MTYIMAQNDIDRGVKQALDWLADVGLAPWVPSLGIEVDVRLIGGEVKFVIIWPDGMMRDGDRWVDAHRHRADCAAWREWGPAVVCETVLDAELLSLSGVRAVWCGAAGTARFRRLLPVSPAAYKVASSFDCVDLWRPR